MRSELPPWSAARVENAPQRAIARLTGRKAVRSGVLWGCVFGVTVASSALGYVAAYPTITARRAFAAMFGSNAGLDAITGPAIRLETVSGYTVWKSLAFLSVLGAVWGLLIATRLLRGEEDAGRWELLLSGQTTRRRATAQVLVGLGVGFITLMAIASLIDVAIGHLAKVHIAPASMLFFTLALVSGAAVFLALGAFTSQLAATRRQAAGYAGAVLGVSYALRMVADSGAGLSWMRWATPLGWVEELRPLTSPRPLALLPIAGLVGILVVGAIHLAGIRDLGASTIADHATAKMHTRLLSGPTGLALRLGRFTDAAWMFAIGATALLLGYVAKQAGRTFSTTPSIERALQKLGAHGTGAQSYLGVAFLIVAVLVVFVAIGQVSAIRSEESKGHLEHFLVRPLSRQRWLADRCLVVVSALVACGVVAGTAAWVGTASQHSGIGFSTLLDAGMNIVPPAACVFGLGVLVIGVWPRATNIVTYGLLAWSFLVNLVGEATHLSHWLLDTSVFHQMTAAPAVAPDWTTGATLLAASVAMVLLGGYRFVRRDLVGD